MGCRSPGWQQWRWRGLSASAQVRQPLAAGARSAGQEHSPGSSDAGRFAQHAGTAADAAGQAALASFRWGSSRSTAHHSAAASSQDPRAVSLRSPCCTPMRHGWGKGTASVLFKTRRHACYGQTQTQALHPHLGQCPWQRPAAAWAPRSPANPPPLPPALACLRRCLDAVQGKPLRLLQLLQHLGRHPHWCLCVGRAVHTHAGQMIVMGLAVCCPYQAHIHVRPSLLRTHNALVKRTRDVEALSPSCLSVSHGRHWRFARCCIGMWI